jgi:hypothetical protein
MHDKMAGFALESLFANPPDEIRAIHALCWSIEVTFIKRVRESIHGISCLFSNLFLNGPNPSSHFLVAVCSTKEETNWS